MSNEIVMAVQAKLNRLSFNVLGLLFAKIKKTDEASRLLYDQCLIAMDRGLDFRRLSDAESFAEVEKMRLVKI